MTATPLPDPTAPLVAAGFPPVVDTFRRWVETSPDVVAVEAEGMSLTYGQLGEWADAIAAELVSHGVERGHRVAIITRRNPGAIATMIATLQVGAVMVPVDASLPPLRVETLLAASDPRVCAVVGSALADTAGRPTVAVPEWPPAHLDSCGGTHRDVGPTDPAYVFFTSGTTGTPKGVLGAHGPLAQFMDWMASEFGIGRDDRVALTRSLGFDAALREVFVPLTVGARIVVAPDPWDPDRILDWVARRRITVLNATPSHADLWLDVPTDLPTALRWVFFSGERLDRPLVERWRKLVAPPGSLVNLYGPTETTFIRSFHRVEDHPDDGPVPVGRPLPASQLLVVDATVRLCGPDEPGEVLIRTAYGTLGYLDGDSGGRFVPNPFTGDADDVVYRTGDVGWYRADGTVVVSGRVDDQVKILGLRVEPAEVAAVLESHPGVRRAVVVGVGESPVRLVGFVVPEGSTPDPGDLRRHAQERLPSPAVPAKILVTDRIPVTSNGKTDREALRARAEAEILNRRPGPTQTARRDDLEDRLARLSPAKRALLEARLRQRSAPPVREAPLSPAQERLWFLDRLYPGRAFYNIPRVHRLHGRLDIEALQRACDLVAARHEILRTRYVDRDGEPVQVVDPPGPAPFSFIDLSGRADAEAELKTIDEAEADRGFDLAAGPIWRVTLIRLGPTEHLLRVVIHHIAADGWSLPILYREMSEAYRAFVHGDAPRLDPLPIQYADYAERQRRRIAEGAYADALRFWADHLRDAPELLSLPTDRPRPPVTSSRGRRLQFRCPSARTDAFTRIVRDEAATPFMVGLALYVALLHRLARTDDLVVGVPSADRSDTDTHSLIGFLVNTLALRSTITPEMTFRDLVRETRRRVIEAFDHREVPFEHVVRELSPPRHADRTPLFQVFFQFGVDAFRARPEFPGVDAEPVGQETTTSKFDLTMYLSAHQECLGGTVVFATDLFDEPTIDGFMREFDLLAGRLLDSPDSPIGTGEPSLPSAAAASPAPKVTQTHPGRSKPDPQTVETMCRIWADLLGVDVGPDDDFFVLGGHSLLAIRVFSQIETEWGVQLPISAIFEATTPRTLAARLTDDRLPEVAEPEAPSVQRYPLSFSQRRLWFLDRLDPGAGNYHTPWQVRLRGRLDLEALQAAVTDLVERHAVFRTRIVTERGEPMGEVDPPGPVEVTVVDVAEEDLSDVLSEEARRPFDLGADWTLRATVFRLGPDDQVLSFVAHHIATDADSMTIFQRELAELYTAHLEGRPPRLEPLPTSYAEFARAQIERFSSRGEPHLRWWLDTLAGELPILDLPTDKARPLTAAREGDTAYTRLGSDVVDALLGLAGEVRATPFMVTLAAFATLLARYTRQDEVVIGIPATERSSLETEGLIGFFVNSLPIRLTVDPNDRFRDLVSRVRQAVLDALDHRDVPFEAIVEHLDPPRDPSRTPIFQTMFDMGHPSPEAFSLPGLERIPLGVRRRRRPAKFDLRAHASFGDGRFVTFFEYRTDLFEPGTIEDMAEQFGQLLTSAVTSPDTEIGDLAMAAPADRSHLPAVQAPTGTVHEAFERIVRERPGSVAVTHGEVDVTFAELDRAADELAAALADAGVRPGDTVGVRMPRSVGIVATLLAILRRGAVYVPLDESYPPERIRTIIEDAKLAAIVEPGPKVERLDRPAEPRLDATQLPAYVMYTSGSTGRPKGVVVPHRAILRLVTDPDYVDLGPDRVVAFASNTGFDAATFEIWGSLLNGGRLVVLDRDVVLSPDALAGALRRFGVTTMFVTTALFNTVVARRGDAFASLDTLLFGGEAVDTEAVRRCLRSGPPRRLVHVYGPTETTTFATWHLVDALADDARTVPIGRPITATTVRVVDASGRDLPRGVPGELVIGGPGVALGYLGDPELTERRFRPSPNGPEYWTGDLVRRRHDGDIEFLGRLDRQVKLRGFRVEPGEIETHLTSHPRIDAAVVVPRPGPSGMQLVAYVVGDVTPGEATDHLRGRIPSFMVPAAIVPIPELPLTPNGKIDLSALPEPTRAPSPYVAPSGEAEERMARLWEEILEVERVGATDDFFALGGHSLLAIKLFAAIADEFGVSAPLSILFEAPTVEALTARIVAAAGTDEAPSPPPVVTIRPGGDRPPLFCFPPAGGNVMVYEPMARAFDGERPILGIQAPGADGTVEPLRTIDALARYCEEVILAVEPEGPYLFAGYSFGGMIAYETARRMRAAQRDVALVVLIDTRTIPPLDLGSEIRRDLDLVRRHGRQGVKVVGRRFLARLRRVAGRVRHEPKVLWYRITGRPLSPLLAGRRLTAASIEAASGYQPPPYDGRVLYLVAGGLPARWRRRAIEPWRQATTGPFDVAEVPGTHKGSRSVMDEPNARLLAERIRQELAREETSP